MAVEFKKYGRWITLSSVMIISGVVWYNRDNPALKGEDLAELYSSVIEKNVAYQTGTNVAPSLALWPLKNDYILWYPPNPVLISDGTNRWDEFQGGGRDLDDEDVVDFDPLAFWITGEEYYRKQNLSAIPLWSLMYDRIMGPARGYATVDPAAGNVRIWWMTAPETLAHGDTVAEAPSGGAWYAIDDHTWGVTPVSNAVSDVVTTTTRVYKPDVNGTNIVFLPGTTATNLPVPRLLYTSATLGHDPDVHRGWGNWWTDQGLGTTVPKLWCEMIEGFEASDVTIETAQAGFDADPVSLSIPYGDEESREVTVTSTDTDATLLRAALFEVSGQNRTPAYFAASDGDYGSFTLNIVVSKKYATVAAGSTTTFTIRPSANPGFTRYVSFDPVRGSDVIRVRDSLNGLTDSWGFGPNNWQTAVSFTITAFSRNSGPTADLIAITYAGKVHYMAVEVTATGSSDITCDPVLLTMTKEGSDTVDISAETAELTTYTDKRIVRKNLDTPKDILQPLTRTFTWVANNQLAYSGAVRNGYSGNPTEYEDFYTDESLHTPDAETYWNAQILEDHFSSTGTPTYNGLIYDIYVNAVRTIFTSVVDDEKEFRSASFFNVSGFAYEYTGCMLPYPSRWAYENGYVASVQIFGVMRGSLPPDFNYFGASVSPSTDSGQVVESVDNYQPRDHDSIDFGLGYNLALHPDGTVTHSGNLYELINYDSDADAVYSDHRLTLLAEATAPASPVTFTLGSDELLDPGYENARIATGYQWWENEGSGFFDVYTNAVVSATVDQRITCAGFIVVTEWAFKHLDAETPFTPAEGEMNDPPYVTPGE